MRNKILFPLISFGMLLFMGIYFLINPSYQKSMQAKYYFEIGDYKEAYSLANEAFSIDVYNRMASTIMAQSKTSLKYVEYIETAKEYIQRIEELTKTKVGICGQGPSDYPDFAHKVATSVLEDKGSQGVLICGSGIGMSMAANRHEGIRAALCHDAYNFSN